MFRKATKAQRKLRLALFGPAGSGKTYSALRLATGLTRDGERIAVLDTEMGSSELYADRFVFDVAVLGLGAVDEVVKALEAAKREGYAVVIIDSLSHAWSELLEEVDTLARTRYGGNTWAAWSQGTPKQKRLVQSLLAYPGHVIATMRARTEWTVQQDKGGRVKPVRVGLAPEQRRGVEYEFDLVGLVHPSHETEFIKDRTGKYQDVVRVIDEDFGRELRTWLEQGEAPAPKPTPVPASRPRRRQQQMQAKPQPTAKQGNGPKADGKNGKRPYSPEALRASLAKAVAYYEAHPPQGDVSGKRGVVVKVLDDMLGGKAERYEVMQYLLGVASSKKWTPAQVMAVWRWLDPAKDDETGEWLPVLEALQEAREALRAARAAQGQQEMLLDEVMDEASGG